MKNKMDPLTKLGYEAIRKKQSMKNMICKYAMFLLPLSIFAQVFLTSLGSTIVLPLALIVGGCFGLISLYFGVNFLQKKFVENLK